jgi:hypothetical protein
MRSSIQRSSTRRDADPQGPEVTASQSAKSSAGGRYNIATQTLERNQRRGSGKVRQKCRKSGREQAGRHIAKVDDFIEPIQLAGVMEQHKMNETRHRT